MSAGSQINMCSGVENNERGSFYTVCLNTYFKKHRYDSDV